MSDRTLSGRVNFDVVLAEGDIGQQGEFPPARFSQRDDRLTSLERLWLGDLTEYGINVRDTLRLNVNYFGAYSTKVANLLMMSEPTPANVVPMGDIHDALIDQTRYGGAVMYVLDGVVHTADARTWYPADDFDYLVIPFTSSQAETAEPDRVTVWEFPSDGGVVTTRTFGWTNTGRGGMFGALLGEEVLGDGRLVTVPKLPRVGQRWGTSKYLEFATSAVEIANRLTRNSRVLDLNGRPVPVMRMSDTDADAEFDVADDDTTTEAMTKIEAGAVDILNREVVRLPNEVQDFKFEQPNVEGVRVSLEQVNELKQAISDLTGLPSLSGEYFQQPASGEALKRIFIHFYAETRSMQNELRQAMEQLSGVAIEWPHIFDVIEAQALARAAPVVMETPDIADSEDVSDA